MNYKSEIEELIVNTSAMTNKPLILNQDFYVIHQPLNHKPLRLPNGKMAVYTFVYNNEFLKIGQVYKNSNARYQSQHYNIKSARSTLARSLIQDNTMTTIVNTDNIAQWIKAHCERFDVIIDDKYGKYTLNFIEGLLHHHFRPRYEG